MSAVAVLVAALQRTGEIKRVPAIPVDMSQKSWQYLVVVFAAYMFKKWGKYFFQLQGFCSIVLFVLIHS